MAFGFGNAANTLGGGSAGAVNAGPDLETIETEVGILLPIYIFFFRIVWLC
jgi:hypothetical protein